LAGVVSGKGLGEEFASENVFWSDPSPDGNPYYSTDIDFYVTLQTSIHTGISLRCFKNVLRWVLRVGFIR
jgi:hypothetical protein